MFNIKNRVYVTFASEIDMLQNRVIVIDPDYDGVVFDVMANAADPRSTGIVFNYSTLDDLITSEFDGNIRSFFGFINDQEKTYIVTTPMDYVKLYAIVMLELKNTYGISDKDMQYFYDRKRLKEYLNGTKQLTNYCIPRTDKKSDFEQVYVDIMQSYQPQGNLFDIYNTHELPLEIVYACYRLGIVDDIEINKKLEHISGALLGGQIYNTITSARLTLGHNPVVLREFLDNPKIVTDDDIILAIDNNSFLRSIIRNTHDNAFNLKDTDNFKRLIDFCRLCIEHSIDFDASPEIDLNEFNNYVELYQTNNVEVLDKMLYNFINTGYISSRVDKFNAILMMFPTE